MPIQEDLLRSEAYSAVLSSPVDGAVERVETHISWVFLVGAHVFKVKRPVNLGFVDFSSPERRRAACEAEVRLNGRLAAGVYRGVVPIRADAAGRCKFGGDGGPIVDWAVRMKRLPDDARADVILERGDLRGEWVDAIATRIAAFHAVAPSGNAIAPHASPEAIAQNVEQNVEQTRDGMARFIDTAQAAEVIRAQRSFVDEHRGRLERRVATGRVRDGHGDLRLEHVYLAAAASPSPDGIAIIDCIEFSDRFRFADVCADIAFLSMDLAAHGRADLAERLLATYAREADDFDLYGVVDFYEGYRAYVRAKIAAIRAGDAGASTTARSRAVGDARRYFLLALSAGRRPLLPAALMAVGGTIASGKSTMAARVGAALGAPVIGSDRTRKALLGTPPTHPLHHAPWQGAYDAASTERVYDEVARRAEVVLESGRPVIVDASFRSRAARVAIREIARRRRIPFYFVECTADADVCRARLAERARTRGVSDGREAIFDAFTASFEPVTELAPGEHIVADTTRPAGESVPSVLARIAPRSSDLVGAHELTAR
ncbi:MAG: AAA family ATPase [Polyangiaceae bacterium]|nr:AAA family ATPase [Polyangiaceae bacterium]